MWGKNTQRYAGIILILLVGIPTGILAQTEVQIDFAFLPVIEEYQTPIRQAIEAGSSLLPAIDRFTVSSMRTEGDWMHAILVPTRIVEADWEAELRDREIIEVLGRRHDNGRWEAYLLGSDDYVRLSQETPTHFITFSDSIYLRTAIARGERISTRASVNFLFPWTSGQEWKKTQGWHYTAIDFSPTLRTDPPVHFAVLAAESGQVTRICYDSAQTSLSISHSDGSTTKYVHLASSTVRTDLLGQNVARGQFLGLIYNGTAGAGPCEVNGVIYDCQYITDCGKGTGPHIHFGVPQNVMIDGYNTNDVAGAAYATPFRSSNIRIDNRCGPNLSGNIGGCTLSAGTYNLTGHIYVNSGDTLHLKPGVTLNYNGHSLTVNGELIWGP